MSSGPIGCRLAGEDDDPRRTVGGERVAATRLLAGLADGRVAGELQGEQRRDAIGGDPLELVRGVVAEQHEPAAAAGLVGRRRDRDPQRGRGGAGQVAAHRGPGAGQLTGRVDRDRVAATALDDHRPAEERPDRRGQHIEAPAEQCEPRQLPLEVGRPAVQPGSPLTRKPITLRSSAIGWVRPTRSTVGQGVRGRRAERLERASAPPSPVDEHDRRDPEPGRARPPARRSGVRLGATTARAPVPG